VYDVTGYGEYSAHYIFAGAMEIRDPAGGPYKALETVEDSLLVVLNLGLEEPVPGRPEERRQTRSGYLSDVQGYETAGSDGSPPACVPQL